MSTKEETKTTNGKSVSLAPLSLKDSLAALLQVKQKPPEEKPKKKYSSHHHLT